MPRQLTVKRTSWLVYRDVLEAREAFTTYGSLWGEPITNPYYCAPSRLYGSHLQEYREACDAKRIDYVVYSYATPIAWHDTEHGWIVPDAKYSVTTSQQQSTIRAACHALNEER